MAQSAGYTQDEERVANHATDGDKCTKSPIPIVYAFGIFFEDVLHRRKGRPSQRSLEYHCFKAAFELIDEIEGWTRDRDRTSTVFDRIAAAADAGLVSNWELIPHLRITGYFSAVKTMMKLLRGYAKNWHHIEQVYQVLDSARLVLEDRVYHYVQYGDSGDETHLKVMHMWEGELRNTYEETFMTLSGGLVASLPAQVFNNDKDKMLDKAIKICGVPSHYRMEFCCLDRGFCPQLQHTFVALRTSWREGHHAGKVLKLMKLATIIMEHRLWWQHRGIAFPPLYFESIKTEIWRRLLLESLPLKVGVTQQLSMLQLTENGPAKVKCESRNCYMHLRVDIDGIKIDGLFDCGSRVSVLTLRTYYQLQRNMNDMMKPERKVVSVLDSRVNTFGTTRRGMRLPDAPDPEESLELEFYVADMDYISSFDCILGANFTHDLGARHPHNSFVRFGHLYSEVQYDCEKCSWLPVFLKKITSYSNAPVTECNK